MEVNGFIHKVSLNYETPFSSNHAIISGVAALQVKNLDF